MKKIILFAIVLSTFGACKKSEDPLKLKVESVETKVFYKPSEEYTVYRDTYTIRSKSPISVSNLKITGDYDEITPKGSTKLSDYSYTFMYERVNTISSYQFDVTNENREKVTYSFVDK